MDEVDYEPSDDGAAVTVSTEALPDKAPPAEPKRGRAAVTDPVERQLIEKDLGRSQKYLSLALAYKQAKEKWSLAEQRRQHGKPSKAKIETARKLKAKALDLQAKVDAAWDDAVERRKGRVASQAARKEKNALVKASERILPQKLLLSMKGAAAAAHRAGVDRAARVYSSMDDVPSEERSQAAYEAYLSEAGAVKKRKREATAPEKKRA